MVFEQIDTGLQKYIEKVCREYSRTMYSGNNFSGCYDHIGGWVRDFFVPLIVARWYSCGQDMDFVRFCSSYMWMDDEIESFIIAYSRYIHELVDQYLNAYGIQDIEDVKILGDVHPGWCCKIGISKKDEKQGKILYSSKYNDDYIWRSIFCSIDNIFTSFFPSIIVDGKIVVRDFVDVVQDAFRGDDVEKYYWHIGYVIALLWIVRGVDINMENVLCHIPYPVIFDYECLMIPELDHYWWEYNVHFTGLIYNDENNNNSLLLWGYTQRISYTTPVVIMENGRPHIIRKVPSRKKPVHIPYFDNEKVYSIDYIKHFFAWWNDFINSKASKAIQIITEWVMEYNPYIRALMRPTKVYDIIISEVAIQRALGNKNIYSYVYQRLKGSRLLPCIQEERNFIGQEVECLLKGIIPSYYMKVADNLIINAEGEIVGLCYRSPFSIWLQQVEGDIEPKAYNQYIKILDIINDTQFLQKFSIA